MTLDKLNQSAVILYDHGDYVRLLVDLTWALIKKLEKIVNS